jgi:hypothetical protein
MRAFDSEVAIALAQLYLVRMLQRTLHAGFIAPCLPTTKTPVQRSMVADLRGLTRLGSNGVFGIEKEHDHDPQAHCYRNCFFFNCVCYSFDSSVGHRRCLQNHL